MTTGCCQVVLLRDAPEVQSGELEELQELLVTHAGDDSNSHGENGKARMQGGNKIAKNTILGALFTVLLWLAANISGGTSGDAIQSIKHSFRAAVIPQGSTTTTTSDSSSELRIDPAVYKDPFMAEYPDEETIAVQNAKFLARKIKQLFDINGFEVKSEGEHVGFFPVMYAGFPKHGTTSAFALMEESMPCLINRRKETHFWSRMFQPVCQHTDKLITSCQDGSVVNLITQYLSGGDYHDMEHVSNEKTMLKSGECQPPFWLDFSPLTMYERTIRLPRGDGLEVVPCDQMVLIHEITPQARFLALAKHWRTDLLRSAWWFYNPEGTGKEYHKDLVAQQQQLGRAMQLGSVCQGHFELKFHRPATNSWAGSCNLAAAVKLFGEDRVFLTEVGPLMRCETDFNRWFATGVGRDLGVESSELAKYGLNCSQPQKDTYNSHTHEREEAQIKKHTITVRP